MTTLNYFFLDPLKPLIIFDYHPILASSDGKFVYVCDSSRTATAVGKQCKDQFAQNCPV